VKVLNTSDQVQAIFMEAGAIMKGHFSLTSGLHSDSYWEKFQVLQWPKHTQRLCAMISDHFRDSGIEVVASPTTGGIIIGYEVARALGVRSIFAERSEAGRSFRRGFDIRPGERVLIVDDILTTGGSVRDVIDEVRRKQGNIVAVSVLVDRSEGKVDLGLPLFPLLRVNVPAYKPEECPLCKQGIPVGKPGGGA